MFELGHGTRIGGLNNTTENIPSKGIALITTFVIFRFVMKKNVLFLGKQFLRFDSQQCHNLNLEKLHTHLMF